MASTRLEGSEGQIAEMNGTRSPSALDRRLSRKGKSEGNLIGKSRLDQRTVGDFVGKNTSVFDTGSASRALLETLSHKQEESKVQPKKHYFPRLVLRPIDSPDLAKDRPRQSTHSGPNSYKLASGARLDVDPVATNCPSCRAASSSAGLEHETQLKTLPTTAVANGQPDMVSLLSSDHSLHRSHTVASDVEIYATGSMSAMRSRSSSISTKSRGINYHALLKRSPSASDIGLPLPPVLSQSLAHCDCSSIRLVLDQQALKPKTAAIQDSAPDLPLQGPSPQFPTRASLDSHKTLIDVLKKISTDSAERSSSVDGDLTENKTLSDYGSSRQAVEEESTGLGGISNHTALSYEKLIVRPTLREGSTTMLTAPLETDPQEREVVAIGTEDYVSTPETFPNTTITVNSLVQPPVPVQSSPGGLSQDQQFPAESKSLDKGWSTSVRGRTQGSKADARRILIPSSSSEQTYTDSDTSSVATSTDPERLQTSRVPPQYSKAYQVTGAGKSRRYSSSDATESIAAARLMNSFRSYPQRASRRAFTQPNTLKAEIGGLHPTQWIRQLLRRRTTGSKPGSPPYLTARPPRKLQSVPLPMASNGIADPLPPPIYDLPSFGRGNAVAGGDTNSRDGQVSETGTRFQRETSDTFNKMIQELEVLLSEALHIAKEASERQITQQLPQILQEATAQLHHEAISSVPSEQTSSTRASRKSLVLSPIAMSSRRSSASLIPIKSRKQSVPAQNRSRSLHNRLASNTYSRRAISAIPSPISRRGVEAKIEKLDASDHILIIEPRPPEHPPSTRKPTAEHLLTPYPNGSAVASQTSLPNSTEKPYTASEYQTQPELGGALQQGGSRAAASPPTESLPAAQRETQQKRFPRSETDTSYQRTPPRFYEGDEDLNAPQRSRQNTDLSYTAGAIYHGRYGEPRKPHAVRAAAKERVDLVVRENRPPPNLPSRDDVRRHIKRYNTPPIQPRHSSSGLRQFSVPRAGGTVTNGVDTFTSRKRKSPSRHVLGGHQEYSSYGNQPPRSSEPLNGDGQHRGSRESRENDTIRRFPSLSNHRHISLRGAHRFSLRRSHRRQPISRDWSTAKKRFTAAVACISTALVGVIVGVYAGEVPAIQYQITDLNHYAILGNVFLYIGLAIPTLVFWPLPLLHGRKPYTLVALALLMPLQFPQGLVVSTPRSPYIAAYRVTLLMTRGLSGLALGFANINFKATLLDLFGSSLQSGNPHQERVIANDVRRHGGGMGVWLSIWSWCFIGSIGVGFLFGALIIDEQNPEWGFWLVVALVAWVLLLNVLTPEVRRSAYRRSVAEVLKGTEVSRRVARGEVKMHIYSTGPKWWWEEVHAGLVLCARMVKQPGFAVTALYSSWIYGQVVIVIVLLGALTSKYYRFRSPYVGLCVSAVPIGALLAVPFQKASLFSRARHHPQRTDSNTFEKRVTWSSHLVRRAFFMLALPFADLAYTLASGGTQTHFMVPTMLAGLIGFLSILAISECNGIIMETFDTSDLQRPSVVGIKRLSSDAEKAMMRRTNYSCYPRVSSAFAIIHTTGFLTAAIATATGGVVERRIGAQAATGAVAGILLLLTVALSVVLWRWKEVQVVPDLRHVGDEDLVEGEDEDGEEWEPVIIGNPSGKMRRMSILELGSQSRWSEIRRLNKILVESGVGMSRWSRVRRSLRRKEGERGRGRRGEGER